MFASLLGLGSETSVELAGRGFALKLERQFLDPFLEPVEFSRDRASGAGFPLDLLLAAIVCFPFEIVSARNHPMLRTS